MAALRAHRLAAADHQSGEAAARSSPYSKSHAFMFPQGKEFVHGPKSDTANHRRAESCPIRPQIPIVPVVQKLGIITPHWAEVCWPILPLSFPRHVGRMRLLHQYIEITETPIPAAATTYTWHALVVIVVQPQWTRLDDCDIAFIGDPMPYPALDRSKQPQPFAKIATRNSLQRDGGCWRLRAMHGASLRRRPSNLEMDPCCVVSGGQTLHLGT